MNTTHLLFPSNLFCDVERTYQQLLAPLYGTDEVRLFVRLLAEEYLGWNTTQWLLHRHEGINQSDLLRFHWALVDLQRQRPIQHIIGSTDFCGCRLAVDKNVLIPRPETEEIVLRTLQHLKALPAIFPLRILDLCTGSGCIAIALKKALPYATVVAVEVSAEALQMARRNAAANHTDILFVQADVLNPTALASALAEQEKQHDRAKSHQEKTVLSTEENRQPYETSAASCADSLSYLSPYSLIISNPPYVRHCERATMHANVLNHEPTLALFVPDDDALRFYHAIAAFASRHLAPQGLITVEINENLGDNTAALLQTYGFSTTLHNDFRNVPRSIDGKRES